MAGLSPKDIVGEGHARCIHHGNGIADGLVDGVVLDRGLTVRDDGIDQNPVIAVGINEIILGLIGAVLWIVDILTVEIKINTGGVIVNDIPIHHGRAESV